MDTFASEFADDHVRSMVEEDDPQRNQPDWRAIAIEQADIIRLMMMTTTGGSVARDRAAASLRRHREALNMEQEGAKWASE